MKVLIVDAFSKSSTGRESFELFRECIKKSFDSNSKLQISPPSFTTCKLVDLRKYCFNADDHEFTETKAIKEFDKLDIIFIDGDDRLLPWGTKTRVLLVLVRMALATGKPLFAAGPGLHLIAHICAAGGQKLDVVNGEGRGGPLKDISLFQCDSSSKNGVFLNHSLGDFYRLDHSSAQWIPAGNVGIFKHCGKVQEGSSGGSKPKKFHKAALPPNPNKEVKATMYGEVTVFLEPSQTNHFLFRGIQKREFLGWCQNHWNVEETANRRSLRRFTVMARSERGAQIVHIANSVGVQFHPRCNYPDSVKIVENFVIEFQRKMLSSIAVATTAEVLLLGWQIEFSGLDCGKGATIEDGILAAGTGTSKKMDGARTLALPCRTEKEDKLKDFLRNLAVSTDLHRLISSSRPGSPKSARAAMGGTNPRLARTFLASDKATIKDAAISGKVQRPKSAHNMSGTGTGPLIDTNGETLRPRSKLSAPCSPLPRTSFHLNKAREEEHHERALIDEGSISKPIPPHPPFYTPRSTRPQIIRSRDQSGGMLFLEAPEHPNQTKDFLLNLRKELKNRRFSEVPPSRPSTQLPNFLEESCPSERDLRSPTPIEDIQAQEENISPEPQLPKVCQNVTETRQSERGASSRATNRPESAARRRSMAAETGTLVRMPLNVQRPYSNFNKFLSLGKKTSRQGSFSVYTGTPYMSEYEKERQEHKKNKEKWVAGAFAVDFGPSSEIEIRPKGGVVCSGTYEDSQKHKHELAYTFNTYVEKEKCVVQKGWKAIGDRVPAGKLL